MEEFEQLLAAERAAIERFVRFRLPVGPDAEDVLQEIYLTAYQKFAQLKNRSAFKAWLVSIARNKCRDYFRKRAVQCEVLTEEPSYETDGRCGVGVQEETGAAFDSVRETMEELSGRDRQILYLYFWEELPQAEIAARLHIPLGTVKSRLFTAKQNFKQKYPYDADRGKGENTMKKLPESLPEFHIEASGKEPFAVKWEELMGWFLVPRLGERLSWGMYEIPSRRCSHVYDMKVTGKAKVHGIEGVELIAREAQYSDKPEVTERTFVAQLTDTHCRYLATLRNDGDIRNYITFLDGEEFMQNWGFGEDNCGNEIHLTPKGDITRKGAIITSQKKDFLVDIVGRYTVTIGKKSYDCVCVMDIETYNCGVVAEQYLDANGRTILWRRFNRDDWALDRYKIPWSEQLPDNDRLVVNGVTYVNWYDCITDYIL